MRKRSSLPPELDLPYPRQRELVRVIYANGGATLREVHAQMEDPPPTFFGVRTLLNRLVRRGLLVSRPSGRHSEVIYLIRSDDPDVQLKAFARIAKEYFGGSKIRAAEALLRLADGSCTKNRRPDEARAA